MLVLGAISVHGQDIKVDSRHRLASLNCQTIDAGHGEELNKLSRDIRKEHFEELCSVRKGKGQLQLLSKDEKDGSKQFVCVIVGDKGNGVFLRVGLKEATKETDDQ